MIVKAVRPVIFIGHGVDAVGGFTGAHRIRQKLRIPVISSPNGMGAFDMSGRSVARLHRQERRLSANEAGRHADLVIAIGARFDDRSASSWIAGYSWNFPELQADPRRPRSVRARAATIRPISRSSLTRAHSCASFSPNSTAGRRVPACSMPGWLKSRRGGRSGKNSLGRISRRMRHRCGPNAWSPIAGPFFPTTRSSPATWV
jgi:thiamine pyrophosphate-dependent acetolactate synthase large subunit-like protein